MIIHIFQNLAEKLLCNRFIFGYFVIVLLKFKKITHEDIVDAIRESSATLKFVIIPRICVISHKIYFCKRMYEIVDPRDHQDSQTCMYISEHSYLLQRIQYG